MYFGMHWMEMARSEIHLHTSLWMSGFHLLGRACKQQDSLFIIIIYNSMVGTKPSPTIYVDEYREVLGIEFVIYTSLAIVFILKSGVSLYMHAI
jgi:hypothetical protein